VGSNFIPSSAINELEMGQADTFDPQEIDKELGWAESANMNTMRVFLHDLLWATRRSWFPTSHGTYGMSRTNRESFATAYERYLTGGLVLR
jgi:hypothetical protein